MAINKQLMALRFEDLIGCRPRQAQAAVQRYCTAVAKQILQHIPKKTSAGHYYVSSDWINQTLGTIMVKGQRYSIWSTIQNSIPERILVPVSIGNNIRQELSLMESKYSLEDIIIASGNAEELVEHLYQPFQRELSTQQYDTVPIDQTSLQAYIQANQTHWARSESVDKPALRDRLDQNLRAARRIQLIAEYNKGELTQIRADSSFGRIYYRGPNLQNCPREVRHAALGDCYRYDIESSVYAWKMSVIDHVIRENKLENWSRPATLEYLDHKGAIRRRLARLLWDSEDDHWIDIIKQAITAIGFGAMRTHGYMKNDRWQPVALEKIIVSPDLRARFLTDAWTQEFVTEQKKMNDFIIETGRLLGQEAEWRRTEGLTDARNRLRPNSIISYMYQHGERDILEWLQQQMADLDVLLTVHDCVYTRRPVGLMELRAGLQDWGQYFRIESEKISGWSFDPELNEHRERIRQEEQQARQLYARPQATPVYFQNP